MHTNQFHQEYSSRGRTVRNLLVAVLVAACCVTFSVQSHAQRKQTTRAPAVPTNPDNAFLAAKDAARAAQLERIEQLRPVMGSDPLAYYLDYWLLSVPLAANKPIAQESAQQFLKTYPNTLLAERLVIDQVRANGRARNWEGVIAANTIELPRDETAAQCYITTAQLAQGIRKVNTNTDANPNNGSAVELIALASRDASDGCVALWERLYVQRIVNRDQVKQRMLQLVELNQENTAKKVASLIFDQQQEQALEIAWDKPLQWLGARTQPDGQVAAIAIARIARNDPDSAEAALGRVAQGTLNSKDEQWVHGQIALSSAKKLQQDAMAFFKKSNNATLSHEGLEWRVRSGLRAGDWKDVLNTIERMDTEQRNESAWVYWKGIALQELKQKENAKPLLTSIAQQHHFYGRLAAEELGLPLQIPAAAPAPTEAEVQTMRNNPHFARAMRLVNLGLRWEGYREWNYGLRGMSDRQLLAAAAYARQIGVLDRMINTAERTQVEHDYAMRFPQPFSQELTQSASQANLEPHWVYGLIRQESRFITQVRSSAGAQGLMQLMPATARWLSQKKGIDISAGVHDVRTNLTLGTTYLRLVYDDLDQSMLLATAAYNAGPGRPRAWRSSLSRPVSGAIFAETIPFNETRDYVKKVLTNAQMYHQLTHGKTVSLKQMLGTVSPRAAGTTQLP